MQWLIIKAISPEASTADYALLEQKDEQAIFTHGNWQTIKDHIGNRRVILLIPSEEVSLHQTAIPTSNSKQMAKAIPFALEDSLAEDIDALHFAFYREKKAKSTANTVSKTDKVDNDVNVAVINRDNLKQWYETAQQQWSIKPYAILPDFVALPADETVSSLLVHHERVLYRYNTFLGMSCTSDLLPLLLPSFLSSHHNADQEPVDEGDEPIAPTLLLDKPDTISLDLPADMDIQARSDLHTQCHRSVLAALPLNLLTGFGQNEQKALLKSLSKWKAAAILVVLIGLLWLVSTGLHNYRAQQYVQQLDAAITAVFKETLPNATVDSDYRVNHKVMAERLNALGVSTKPKAPSPLEPLALVTPILKRNNSINLKKLSIENNELILAISVNSVSRLESFHSAINRNANLQAEIKAQNTAGNKVVATLHIRTKKP